MLGHSASPLLVFRELFASKGMMLTSEKQALDISSSDAPT